MTDSSDEKNFYVPRFVRSTFQGLLLPGQKLEEIFDQIGGLIFEGFNEIRPDKTIWDSKTMTLNSKKPRTLDMFFKKVVKTEASDVDSNCSIQSSNDGTVIEESNNMNKFKNSPDSLKQLSGKEKKKTSISEKSITDAPSIKSNSKNYKSKSNCHSISSSDNESLEKNVMNSPTYSVDLFADDIQQSSDHLSKINSEHSLSDDEITPTSQVHPSSKQNTSKKSNTQTISLEKELSTSSSDEESEQPAFSKLDLIKNSMKNLKEVFSEIERNTEKFSYDDLTEDDELYILQCPSEIDSKKLEGVELTLEGNSIVSIDEDTKYDSFSIKEKPKRCLYIALPDSNEQRMKLGVLQLAGNIILSENLGIPYTKPIEDQTKDDSTLEVINTSLNEEPLVQHTPKKKKKHRNTDDTLNYETSATECFSRDVTDVLKQLASKKKKRKHTSLENSDVESRFSELEDVKSVYEDTQIIPDTQDQVTPLKTKKKKKRSLEGEDLSSSFYDVNQVQKVKSDWENSEIIPDTQDQETPSKSKKKKKRSMEGEDLSSSFYDVNQVQKVKSDWENSEIIPDTQDQETPSKSKKKKKRSMEGEDLSSSFYDVNQVQKVKSDWENSEIIPDTQDQETPSKSKKKKKRHMEGEDLSSSFYDLNKVQIVKTDLDDSQIIPNSQDQEALFKVKKKKRKDKGDTTQDEATESEYFSENVTDVLNKLASKKKKRKHYSMGSNELTDYESEIDKSVNIKIEWEEPQVISDFQETPSKSNKRNRKELEDSEEFSQDEVQKKKKKKKYSS